MTTDLSAWAHAAERRRLEVEAIAPAEWCATAYWVLEHHRLPSPVPYDCDWVEFAWQGFGATAEEAVAALAEYDLPEETP